MTSTLRARVVALTSATVLSLAMVGAPAAVVAQDTPEAAVQGIFDKMTAWEFGAIVDSFCAEQSGAADALDFGGQFGEAMGGIDTEMMQAAISFGVDDLVIEILEQTDTTARVQMMATLAISLDPDGARALVEALLSGLGEDLPEGIVDEALAGMEAELAGEAQTIDETIDLVVEDGVWKVCSPVGPGLGGGADAAGDDA